VSTLIKNTVKIGYFAKITILIRILACFLAGLFLSPFLPPHNWSLEAITTRQMPSMARQIDHVGDNGEMESTIQVEEKSGSIIDQK
jgi:hypothetical protein